MKHLFSVLAIAGLLFTGVAASAQAKTDKSKRPSPPVKISQQIGTGATITIDYGQPSVKGRTIGVDLEPKTGEVWRTGANEATTFETDRTLVINGDNKLAPGKYALFTIWEKEEWTIIFNKTWNQWGAYDYKKADDALRVTVKDAKAPAFGEKLTFSVDKEGKVSFVWGDHLVAFSVK